MAARQQITFEPSLTHVFAENFHHSPISGQVILIGLKLLFSDPIRDLEEGAPPFTARGNVIGDSYNSASRIAPPSQPYTFLVRRAGDVTFLAWPLSAH